MAVEVNEELWYEYALECEEDGVRASISDYLVWLDEQPKDTDVLDHGEGLEHWENP